MTNATLNESFAKLRKAFLSGDKLHPDLRKSLIDGGLGKALRHPLVSFPIYSDELASYANESYAAKKVRLVEADSRKDFNRAVFLHERPWRLQAYAERAHLMSAREKGNLIGEVWADSEHPHINLRVWRMLWREPDVALHAMGNKELMAFDALKQKAEAGGLTLWRGTGKSLAAGRGLSWTTDRKMAEWFAAREGRASSSSVWQVKPPPDRMLAFLDGRGEDEVILDTRGLRGIHETGKGRRP